MSRDALEELEHDARGLSPLDVEDTYDIVLRIIAHLIAERAARPAGEVCNVCHGTGHPAFGHGGPWDCGACDGSGKKTSVGASSDASANSAAVPEAPKEDGTPPAAADVEAMVQVLTSKATSGWWVVRIGTPPNDVISGEFRVEAWADDHARQVRDALRPLLTAATRRARGEIIVRAVEECRKEAADWEKLPSVREAKVVAGNCMMRIRALLADGEGEKTK